MFTSDGYYNHRVVVSPQSAPTQSCVYKLSFNEMGGFLVLLTLYVHVCVNVHCSGALSLHSVDIYLL